MSARWDDATVDRLDALRAASGLPRMAAVELQHEGVHGVLIGPTAHVADVVRPEAVVEPATTWCRACSGTGDEWVGDDVEQCAVCAGTGQHAVDLTYGVVDGAGGRVLYDGAQAAPVALMTEAEAHAEVGWVAREAVQMMRGASTDVEVLEYFTRKAALLEHIASTQVGDERRETLELAAQARAEVATRTAPAPTRGEQLHAIADDLDTTTAAWAAAGHPDSGPEYEAREAVFARLREWNASS